MTGTIPQSDALAEASPNSVSELLSKAPPYTPEDRKRIVGILREQRVRWEAAEAAGLHTRAKKAPAASLSTNKSPEDLGL